MAVDRRADPELLAWVDDVAAPADVARSIRGSLPAAFERRRDGGRMLLVDPVAGAAGVGGDASSVAPTSGPRPFYCDETEVTVGQFARFVAATGYATAIERGRPGWGLGPMSAKRAQSATLTWRDRLDGDAWDIDALPVVLIDWQDARAFADWVGCELPSEQEFECAVRWGRPGKSFPWGDAPRVPPGAGNFGDGAFRQLLPRGTDAGVFGYDDGVARRARVRSFARDPLGTFDLIGNVWEWTRDRWMEEVGGDDGRPGAVVNIVVRGGGWDSGVDELTCAARGYAPSDQASDVVGFRCVSRRRPPK